MPIDKKAASERIAKGDFTGLFTQELGWDWHSSQQDIDLSGQVYRLTAVAEKRGFVVWHCPAPAGHKLPDYALRRKIEHQTTKLAHEHMLIFTDESKTVQIWQWVEKEPGKPAACREHHFIKGQTGEALLQKLELIAFTLDEEETLVLTDVTRRTRAGFDVEKITKKFYDQFKKEHSAFFDFIKGITESTDHEWYASVMLNRLMFVYFVQRKGFLDGDRDYLRNRLNRCKEEKGKDQFYSFYRFFLLRLFHEGLGQRPKDRAAGLEVFLGKIPYLNGGLFERHKIEIEYPKIEIPDSAFERIFDYFDQYQWHLDERPLRADNEINPDVLGYIFEKYINQKQMGAYYTKEDITEYISKNTVIPFLFDAARAKCKIAFENTDGKTVWDILKTDPDRYIYEPVRRGVTEPLPKEIEIGVNSPTLHQVFGEGPVKTLELRKAWNKPAPPTHGLRTEIWREVVARRKRYEEIKSKLSAGEVREINDLITLNLDIRQFAQDVIEQCEGPDLLRAFWYAIERVTILDPTCGSGAFLFAALNILDPLYESCLDRMESFLRDESNKIEVSSRKFSEFGTPILPHKKFEDFTKTLDHVADHPNRRYFIFKSIILNNLYGVDIMEEATEICKLRLFLKLAAQVEPDASKANLGIEPLPDIDFNIRAGNTLIGFASLEEVRRTLSDDLIKQQELPVIEEKAAEVDRCFKLFRKMQTEQGMDAKEFVEAKRILWERLKALEDELNRYLATEYRVKNTAKAFSEWKKSHQPFHWFVDFYGILKQGGFDVIIGNPPYVEYTKKDKSTNLSVRDTYLIRNYKTLSTNNLYAFTMERTLALQSPKSWSGMIVPVSFISGDSYAPLVDLTCTKEMWLSSFSNRPAKLFDGVEQRLTIYIRRNLGSSLHSAPYSHWYSEERGHLFARLAFMETLRFGPSLLPIKIGRDVDRQVIDKIICHRANVTLLKSPGINGVWFHDGPTYWIRALPFEPNKEIKSARSNHYHCISAASEDAASIICALLNSSTFYMFFKAISNCRDFGGKELYLFSLPNSLLSLPADLVSLAHQLGRNLKSTAHRTSRIYDSGKVHYEEYYPQKSKSIIDEIDTVLARHYGFTEEELDFIINYDIKYRMGRQEEEEE